MASIEKILRGALIVAVSVTGFMLLIPFVFFAMAAAVPVFAWIAITRVFLYR